MSVAISIFSYQFCSVCISINKCNISCTSSVDYMGIGDYVPLLIIHKARTQSCGFIAIYILPFIIICKLGFGVLVRTTEFSTFLKIEVRFVDWAVDGKAIFLNKA